MPKETSSGIVVFINKEGKRHYLLLHYQPGHWDFPKGHIEKGETEQDTALRETKEETGIDNLKIIPGFRQEIKYYFRAQGRTIFKTVSFYLAESQTDKVTLSGEHIGYKWLAFEEALKQLSFKNAKEILKKANDFCQKS